MAYTRVNWEDLPSTNTPRNATNLNKMDAGIKDNDDRIKVNEDKLSGNSPMGSIVVDDINCKNLFDFSLVNKSYSSNGITFTNNGDGTFTANGTATAVAYWDIITNMQGTGYYTLSGCPAGGSNTSYMQILMRYSDYNGIDDTGSGATRSFTSGINYGIRLRIASGYVCNNVVFRPMLEKGNTVTPYTPYKKIIKEQNGYVKEDTTFYANDFKCKNLFDYNSSKFGYVLGSGGAESTASGFLISDYIPVTPNTTYTISRLFNNVSGAENTMRIGYYQQDKTFIDRPSSSDNPYAITTPSNCYYVRLSYQYQSQGQTSNDKVQLEIGNEATPYTPYKNFDNTIYTLWTNPSPTSNFANQTIQLNDSIDNYSYYEIIYRHDTTYGRILSTGKIPSNSVAWLQLNRNYNYFRLANVNNGNQAAINDCNYFGTYGNTTTTTANSYLIPLQIIAYK